ncbi:hypothetical protein F53441_8170 [Fusarium austroafricanum]|uniref:Uncharacterized protein n=1 Tax=Fusarium austroafricanum TaxID=2364996 RepID=A0A8H4KE69_9HYPO|nr:hypothetical protein F53441_8170 [Fusarium austroafricanum]
MTSNVGKTTNDGWCYGQIQANSDIAGWGTIATFTVNACMGVLASSPLWLAQVKKQLQEARTGPPSTPTTPASLQRLTSWDELLISVADTNLVSALGVVISSLVNFLSDRDAYPNYHLWIAWILADLALMGFSAASVVYRRVRNNQTQKHRLIPRIILAGITWALWMCWTCLILGRFQTWEATWEADKSVTPQCFSTHLDTLTSGLTFTFWIYINLVWVSQSFIWIISTPFQVHIYLDRWLSLFDIWLIRLATSIPNAVQSLIGRRGSMFAPVIIACVFLSQAPTFLLVLFFIPSHMMDLPFVLIFVPWDIYDIYVAKKSNQGIVVDVPTQALQYDINNNAYLGSKKP